MRLRWPLAVWGVIAATRANSVAVSARPSIKACSMLARPGSPDRAATSANRALVGMASAPQPRARILAKDAAKRFGEFRTIAAHVAGKLRQQMRTRPGHDHHGIHSLPDRPRPARRLRGLRARLAQHHTRLRRQA